MAYIEVRTTLPGHRKVAAAARRLGVPRPAVVGHLVCFWAWALENVPSSGSLRGVEPMDIAHAAGWPAKQRRTAERFVRDLVQTGWISEEDGELFIHDWGDYAGRLLTKREADAARKRAERAAARSATSSVQRTSSGREPQPKERVQRTSRGPRARAVAPHRTAPTPKSSSKPGDAPSARASSTGAAPAGTPYLDIEPDDPRYPVARLLATRFGWKQISTAEWDAFGEEVDNEHPSGTKRGDRVVAWQWLAGQLAKCPKREPDPKRWFFDQRRRVKDERAARAAADVAQRCAVADAPIDPRIAEGIARIGNGTNGHRERFSREELVERFREYRGQIDDDALERQLQPHGLTLADLEDPVDFGAGGASHG